MLIISLDNLIFSTQSYNFKTKRYLLEMLYVVVLLILTRNK